MPAISRKDALKISNELGVEASWDFDDFYDALLFEASVTRADLIDFYMLGIIVLERFKRFGCKYFHKFKKAKWFS